jgi:primosomal protein N' (replication factor Y)
MYFESEPASKSSLTLAEPAAHYQEESTSPQWIEVLADSAGIDGLLTYKVRSDLTIQPGDILSVPLGRSLVGAIAIRFTTQLPENLEPHQIREVEEIITSGFFPPRYWYLLEKVAKYYCSDLITVVRVALPPGLLGRSRTRIRLKRDQIPPGAETFCSRSAGQILSLLQTQSSGDYSSRYIQTKIKGARRGIQELSKRGWIETYLEQPKRVRPKLTKAVTFIRDNTSDKLTQKQLEVLHILKNSDGELWLKELLGKCELHSDSVVKTLAKKGYVVIEERETLRLLREENPTPDEAKNLTSAQNQALEVIFGLNRFATVLLHGVTGSGKTEVYLQAIAPILERNQSALVLVPEIGLTPQLTDRFRARFGRKVCVYHSKLSDGERYDTWRQMLTGEPQVLIGTRSAVFAPLPNIGIIILDEEHDPSFKQSKPTPTYHAGKIAQWRAELVNCPLILGSATPSLETWIQANSEPLNNHTPHIYLSLPERIEKRPLPPVKIVDMRLELQRGNRSIFSHSLQQAIIKMREAKKQGILFISRRGHSTFVSCRTCGYVIECPHCDVSLSYHYSHEGSSKLLRCHYCNHTSLHPENCPECGSPYLKFFGTGTQKVVQELKREFPEIRSLRFDSDTTRTKGSHRAILDQFAQGKADLLIGTQMLTKGLDLAQVTLVGVVSADGLLYHSDYRASERAFQTLTQVAGRAGRGNDPGQVIIQTYSPDHPVIKSVCHHDYDRFSRIELEQRESLNYPPYGNLILLRFSGTDSEKVRQTAEIVADACQNLLGKEGEILGPAPANIMRVARRYRWQILLKFLNLPNPFPDLNSLREYCSPSVSMIIDVDPLIIE